MSFSSFSNPVHQPLPLLAGRNYHCQCGQPVFFRNSKCLSCDTPLGYECERGMLLPLMRGPTPDTWVEWQAGDAPTSAPLDTEQPTHLEDIPGQESTQPAAQSTDAPNHQQRQQQQQQQQQQQEPVVTPVPPQAMAMAMEPLAPAQGLEPEQPAEPKPPEWVGLDYDAERHGPLYKRCMNLSTPATCNWLLAANDSQSMCRACRLNRTIPDLTDASFPDNGYLWGLVELAKRRLVSALIILKLPVASRISEDTQAGMMFDFLRSPLNGPHVMTGHNTGLITLNVDEADDVKREAVRKAMREPYRTLLGHFRHEVGHYYWDRLVRGTPWMDGFHRIFGDETANYAESLKRNYDEGPPSDWPLHFVSAYASTHPWEDWAECWAHYLHMRDAVDTALSFGLSVDKFDLEFTPFTIESLYEPDHEEAAQFLGFLNHWTRLTTMLNEMSRSMGQPDFYPFILPRDVIAKLHFIHLLVSSESWLREDTPPDAVPPSDDADLSATAEDAAPLAQAQPA